MAGDKKNIHEAAPPTEAPTPTAEVTAVPEPPAPDPVLTDAEAVMLEQEQAALFEMGDAMQDPADAVTHAEVEEPAEPKVPKVEKGAGAAVHSRQGRSYPGTLRQGGGYEIIADHCRRRASELAGFANMLCILHTKKQSVLYRILRFHKDTRYGSIGRTCPPTLLRFLFETILRYLLQMPLLLLEICMEWKKVLPIGFAS